MQLIQLFLPLYDNEHQPFAKAKFDAVRTRLTEKFGGVTAFVHSPAVGLWESDSGQVCRDDVILFEVMADSVDRNWWFDCRKALESEFEQEAVLVRSMAAERL